MNIKAIIVSLSMLGAAVPACAQQMSGEEREKKNREFIESEIERCESGLELEYWQVFYLDSILTHNIGAMQEETMRLSAAKVGNTSLYQDIQDKWAEATYVAMKKVLSESQWVKYCKMGAAREKKARDRRASAKI